jgi:PAS domain S-box-containing protein
LRKRLGAEAPRSIGQCLALSLNTLLDSAPDAILIVNQERLIVRVNCQTEKLFGYRRDELLQKPVEILLPEQLAEKHREYTAGFIAAPKQRPMAAGLEIKGRRKDGTEFPVEISLSPLQTQQGMLVCSIIRDTTDRQAIQEALRGSEVRYRRLFETAKDGILILDAETGEITDVNPFLIDMLGYSRHELQGKKLWEIGAFRDIEASRAAFRKLQHEEYVRYEDLPLQPNADQFIEVEFVSNVYRISALEICQQRVPDLLLTDVVMPGMNGIELAIAIRQQFIACQILLFSGHAETSEILQDARRRGFDFELLAKPLHPEQLLRKIKELLGTHDPHQQRIA